MSFVRTGVYIHFCSELHVPFKKETPCHKDSPSNQFKCESKYFSTALQEVVEESILNVENFAVTL